LTLENLRALDPETRLARLEAMAVELFGHAWATKLATLLELAPSTVFRWKSKPASVPFMALIVLHGMVEQPLPQDAPAPQVTPEPDKRMQEAAAALIAVSRALARAAEVLAVFSEPVRALQTVQPETPLSTACQPTSAE